MWKAEARRGRRKDENNEKKGVEELTASEHQIRTALNTHMTQQKHEVMEKGKGKEGKGAQKKATNMDIIHIECSRYSEMRVGVLNIIVSPSKKSPKEH